MEKEQLILNSAQEYNILPLTSGCDVRCIFCSHRQNPPSVQTVSIGPRTLEEAERTMEFLDGSRRIFIGESATRIIEGEPFTHPQIREILLSLRRKFPQAAVSITTNGNRLDKEMVQVLKDLQPLEINLSLNSLSAQGRRSLMGIGEDRPGTRAACLLKEYGIPFHGSLVAMPGTVGWEDIGETILFLDRQGARTIRVFLPGFTRLAEKDLVFDPEVMHRELAAFIKRRGLDCNSPVLLEPPLMRDLSPVTAGVIRGSAADRAGLLPGDLIRWVNGREPRSRVEAWQMLQEPGKITLRVLREGREISLAWDNLPGEKSGAVMEYDFDMDRWAEVAAGASGREDHVLILSSTLAAPLLRMLAGDRIRVLPVPSVFFGGSIGAAGLLTVEDFLTALEKWKKTNPLPEFLFLPREAFDYRGMDLTGRGFWELEEKSGIPVKII